mgnify:CR=1 FL=1
MFYDEDVDDDAVHNHRNGAALEGGHRRFPKAVDTRQAGDDEIVGLHDADQHALRSVGDGVDKVGRVGEVVGGAEEARQQVGAEVAHLRADRVLELDGLSAAAEELGGGAVDEAVGDALVEAEGGDTAAGGDIDTGNTLENVTVFANANRAGFEGIRSGEGGAGDAGANSEYLRLINVTIRGGYNDSPATQTMYGKGLVLAHGNVKSTYLQNVTISQADTIISTTSGGFTAIDCHLHYSNRLLNATGSYDPITIINLDSEGVGAIGTLGSGAFAMIGGRMDRETNMNALVATANWIGDKLGRPKPSAISRAGGFPKGEAGRAA